MRNVALLLLGALLAAPLVADPLSSGWSWTMACPSNDAPAGPVDNSYGFWDTPTPGSVDVNFGGPVVVGMKFQASTEGNVTGARFYKGVLNTGTHVAHLWTEAGGQLATATFTGETASGWQSVNFPTPVALTPYTTYVISLSSGGRYNQDNGYFSTYGLFVGPLGAHDNTTAGGQGLRDSGASGTFPTTSGAGANYWVDVIFTTSEGSFTSSGPSSFSGSGGCQRVASGFNRIDLTSYSQPVHSTTLYALDAGNQMIFPPILSTETMPVFTVDAQCPSFSGTKALSWIFVQWDAAGSTNLQDTYLIGTATYSQSGGIVITGQYDVDGSAYWTGPHPMDGSCSGGIYTATNPNQNASGQIFMNANAGGVFKSNQGFATFFAPQHTVSAASELGSQVYAGITFNSAVAADTRSVRVTADAPGTTFVVEPYADVELATIDASYVDTIVITGVNTPANGILVGTVTRTGTGAGTGNIACVVDVSSYGTELTCSGQSPPNNSRPYNVTFHRKGTPGTPAASFNGGAVLALNTSSGGAEMGAYGGGRVAFQSDGKALIAAPRNGGGTAVVRVNADGTVDTSYGSSGYAHVPIGSVDDWEQDIAVQSDGKAVVVGSAMGAASTAAALAFRLNTNGTLDTTFDGDGKVTTALGGYGFVDSVIVQSDGKILAGGGTATSAPVASSAVIRYLSDGSLDTSFGTGGIALNPSPLCTGTEVERFHALTTQSDGKIIAVGETQCTPSGNRRFLVVRMNSDGTLDTSFSGDGFAIFTPYATQDANQQSRATSVVVQPDGKILVGGPHADSNAPADGISVARLNANGTLDTTFNWTGYYDTLATQPHSVDWASRLLLFPDGQMLLAAHGTNANEQFVVLRLSGDGLPDTTFGTSGLATIATGRGNPRWSGAAMSGDGRVLIVSGGYGPGNWKLSIVELVR